MRHQPFASPEEALEHYGVKGMRWGVRKEREGAGREAARANEVEKERMAPTLTEVKPFVPRTQRKSQGTVTSGAELQEIIDRVARTDNPQVVNGPKISGATQVEKKGLSREQKMLITFGVATAAGAGYLAYRHYVGNQMPGVDLRDLKPDQIDIEGMKLPSKWNVAGLKNGPLSTQRLGDLAGGDFNAKLLDSDNLVINTARGYADILPKNGFANPYAAEQHASVTRVLEEMRDKFPAIRNMNIEVAPMSVVPGMTESTAYMSVLSMRAGEARVMYNDLAPKPSAETIQANLKHLPGLGKKDYMAYHEMGHLLAVAHGDLPPAFDLVTGNAGPSTVNLWARAEPLLHKRTMAQHGFSFKELSKLSRYAATEPAEAVAELAGHYFHPEMRQRLSADQLRRAEAMFNEMGGLG